MNLYGPKQLAESMRTVRKNTIQIAEDIPEKDYSYRPTLESRSVLETLVHIASLSRLTRSSMKSSTYRRSKALTSGPCSRRGKPKKKPSLAKSDVVPLLLAQGDRWCQWLEGLSESLLSEHVRQPGGTLKTRFEMLVGTKEHEIHHRGQLMVIERLLGIVPHLTRSRQSQQVGLR